MVSVYSANDDNPIFPRLRLHGHWLSYRSYLDTNDIQQNSRATSARRVDGPDDGRGLRVPRFGPGVRGLHLHSLRNVSYFRHHRRDADRLHAVAASCE